jgi:hypothetical protein
MAKAISQNDLIGLIELICGMVLAICLKWLYVEPNGVPFLWLNVIFFSLKTILSVGALGDDA